MFGRPAVRVDAVENMSGVVVHGAQCTDDSEALVTCRLDAARALVERSFYQHSTCLTSSPSVTLASSINTQFTVRSSLLVLD